MKFAAIPATLCLAVCAAAAGAGPYKWVDENGRVHYTQTKPSHTPSQELGAPPPPPSDSYDLNKPFADQIRAAGQPSGRTPPASQTANPDQCALARANLNALQNNARVRYQDQDGNLVIMPEDVRQQKLRETQEHIGEYCG